MLVRSKSIPLHKSSAGLWEGQLFAFDVVDAHGDIVPSDAEIALYEAPLLVEHDPFTHPVGSVIAGVKKEGGYYVLIKSAKDLQSWYLSAGLLAMDWATEPSGTLLKKIFVYEVSVTQNPAQPNSPITSLKYIAKNMQELAKITERLEALERQLSTRGAKVLQKQTTEELDAMLAELSQRVSSLEEFRTAVTQQLQAIQEQLAALSAGVQESEAESAAVINEAKSVIEKSRHEFEDALKRLQLVIETIAKL